MFVCSIKSSASFLLYTAGGYIANTDVKHGMMASKSRMKIIAAAAAVG